MAKDVTYIENTDPNRPLSRYNKIRLYVGKDDYVVQESWDNPEIPERNDDSWHEVGPGEDHRPDLVALLYYGSAELYWVLAAANKMIDPFAETVIGYRMRIPNRENLFATILVQ